MNARSAILWERLGILAACALYLWVFNREVPHGDALRIVRQVEASHLVWNPNHLLFDPLGYAFHHLLSGLGSGISILGSFELLAAIATLVSMWLFHALLCRAGVASPALRVLTSAALFASASFVQVAVSNYFFMVQMPFLIGTLYCYVDFAQTRAHRSLYLMGGLLALSTAIMFNNLLLTILTGIAVGSVQSNWRNFEWRNSLRLWAVAAAVGFPVFLIGHALSDSHSNLVTWVLSYEGTEGGGLNEHYGLKWTLSRVIQGAAMVAYNFLLGNMVENAGLATVLGVLAFGNELEFLPQWGSMLLSLAVSFPVVLLHLWLTWFLLRNLARDGAVRMFTAWLTAYLLFNFLWNVGDENFWLQILPVIWLALLYSQGATPALAGASPPVSAAPEPLDPAGWRFRALAGVVVLLLVVNTLLSVVPVSSDSYAINQRRHTEMLRNGDLEIVPGWDQQKWMAVEEGGPEVRKLLLMNMALKSKDGPAELPAIIDEQLARGGRVIVARVFDKDEDLMPWYSLADRSWPRTKIQKLLSPYCTRPLETIDGIVFRELYACAQAEPGKS
jgi:hypothetical protein